MSRSKRLESILSIGIGIGIGIAVGFAIFGHHKSGTSIAMAILMPTAMGLMQSV